MVRNSVPSWFVVLLTVAMSIVCASGDEGLHVVTSTTDLASLVQKIGGNRVAVTSLSRGYQDPHFVPVNARSLLNLNRADLFLVIGLQMELAWLGEGLSELSPIAQCRNPRIQSGSLGYFDVSPYVQVVERPDEITRAQGIHPLGNSHYWLDPDNGRRMAQAITTKLSALRPNDAAYFEQQFALFSQRLANMERLWDKKIEPYHGYKVVTYHRAWGNFLKRFRLVSVGEIEPLPGIPPNDTHTSALIREMKRQKVRVILVEPCYEFKNPERIATDTGARVLVVPGSVGGVGKATDYFSLLEYDIESLVTVFQLLSGGHHR